MEINTNYQLLCLYQHIFSSPKTDIELDNGENTVITEPTNIEEEKKEEESKEGSDKQNSDDIILHTRTRSKGRLWKWGVCGRNLPTQKTMKRPP